MSSATSTSSVPVLAGEWPMLQEASTIPEPIMEAIAGDKTSLTLTNNLGFLSLGHFFIDIDLIQPHPFQRQIIPDHARQLKEDFETQGVLRAEHPGVVISLGEGWNLMKNNGPIIYRIRKSSSFLNHLSLTAGGPIAEVIRGGHRTEAIRQFASIPEQSEENYWLYKVLLPSKL